MKINYVYEPVIILKDLCFELLYRWRSILAAAVIGALLFGGYQYYTGSVKNAPAQKTQENQSQEANDLRMEEYNLLVEQYQTELQKYNSIVAMYQ